MNYSRAAWIVLGAIAGIAAIGRFRRRSASAPRVGQRDTVWDLPDDLIQAAANVLPHESEGFDTR